MPSAAIPPSAWRYRGSRPTVASGIDRSLTGEGTACSSRESSRNRPGIHKCTSGRLALLTDHLGEPICVDGDLEGFFPVDLDHGDPDPVFELELVVGFDVDLGELEPEPRSQRQDRLPSHVAEVASRT